MLDVNTHVVYYRNMDEAIPQLHDLCLYYLDHPRDLEDCGRICDKLLSITGADIVLIAHSAAETLPVTSWSVSSSGDITEENKKLLGNWAQMMCRRLEAGPGETRLRVFQPLPREDRPINGEAAAFYMEIRDENRFHGVVFLSGESERFRTDPKNAELFVRILALLCSRCSASDSSRSMAARFEQFMENIPAYAFIKDGEGKYIFTNQAYKKLGSVDPKARIDRKDYELFPAETARRLRKNDETVLRNGVPLETIEELSFAGETQYHLTVKFPLTEADGEVRLAGIAVDITRLVEVEHALEASLEEKEILYRELQHRVKNTFSVITSLLRLEDTKGLSRESGALLRKLQNRIEAVSLVYRNLYGKSSSDPLDASRYLGDISRNLVRSYSDTGSGGEASVSLETGFEPLELAPDTAVPLGIILTELMTNAFKYGFPDGAGTVRTSLSEETGGRVLRVFNDGVPLPESVDVDNPESLGLRLVQALTSQLKGSLSVSREGGTEFIVSLPPADSAP